jgi:hypothetical protein
LGASADSYTAADVLNYLRGVVAEATFSAA